jgi:hypothetical protein
MDYTDSNNKFLRLVEKDKDLPSEVDVANSLLEECKETFTGFVIVGFGANKHKGMIKVMQTHNLDGSDVLWLHRVMDKYISDNIVRAPEPS